MQIVGFLMQRLISFRPSNQIPLKQFALFLEVAYTLHMTNGNIWGHHSTLFSHMGRCKTNALYLSSVTKLGQSFVSRNMNVNLKFLNRKFNACIYASYKKKMYMRNNTFLNTLSAIETKLYSIELSCPIQQFVCHVGIEPSLSGF